MADTKVKDPLQRFKFSVSIIGAGVTLATGRYSKVSGLKAELETTEYREAGDVLRIRRLPGFPKYEDITLERGMMDDTDFWQLYANAVNGVNDRFEMIITEHDRAGNPVRSWACHNCWVKSYETGEHDAQSAEVLEERIVVSTEWFEAVPVS